MTPVGQPAVTMDKVRRFGHLRLDHPEGVVVGLDDRLYCGGELGQIYAVGLDDSVEEVANTGGDILGLAFDGNGRLYVCDRGLQKVVRIDVQTGAVEDYCTGLPERPTCLPNYLCFDPAGRLYVTDSRLGPNSPSGCVFVVEADGETKMWWTGPSYITNGCALSPHGDFLYLVESLGRRIVRVPILPNGQAGTSEVVVDLPDTVPDGVAFGSDGTLYISLYRPDEILGFSNGRLSVFVSDPWGLTLCAPTNISFHNNAGMLISANLCSRHLSGIPIDFTGLPLAYPVLAR